jgi:hypothetical protein
MNEEQDRLEFEELQKVARQEYENNILKNLRDAVADAYVPLFPPHQPTNVSWKVERLLSYLSLAITLHLDDFEEGWWEENELMEEYDNLFIG